MTEPTVAPRRTPEDLRVRYPDAVLRADGRGPAPVAVTPVANGVTDPAEGLDAVLEVVEDGTGGEDDVALLAAAGAGHLERLRAAHPRMHDGAVLRWLGTTPQGRLRVARGGYFGMVATCDALRAEWESGGAGTPLRDLAHERCGDPLRSGAGRVAALGLSVVVTVPSPGDPAGAGRRGVLLGRRSARNALDVGSWHVAPSGMVEPAASGPGSLTATLVTELAEELGVHLDPADASHRARVLGVVHDLLRLRPDVVVRLDLDDREAAGITHGPEFDALTTVALATATVPAEAPPSPLTPAAAGAFALLAQASSASISADCQ
ncbi:MAG: hypothetical protein U0Q15_19705 [Kineosporiaceae bacterium]